MVNGDTMDTKRSAGGPPAAPGRAPAPGRGRPTRRRLAAAVGPAALLGACRGGGERTAAGQAGARAPLRAGATITWAVDDGPTRTPLRQEQVRLFTERFPALKVEYLLGATATDKVQTLVAAGTPPDLFRQETHGMALFASRGQVVPLDPLLKRDRYDLSDFFPAVWDLWTWRGQRYGVPFLGIRVVYTNRTAAAAAGVAAPPATWRDGAWTWAAFLDTLRRVTVRQGDTASRWGADLGTGRRDWQPWVWNNGGDLVDAAGARVLLAEPPAVEALQFLADLIHRHRVAPTPAELEAQGGRRALFQANTLLLYHNPVGDIAANRRASGLAWGLAGLPRGKGQTVAASGGGVGWFLSTDSRVKDETWELLKHLAGRESVRLEAERGEAPPSRRSVAAEPAFLEPAEAPGAEMRVVAEALEALRPEVPLLEGVEIDRILDEELLPLWRGEKTAREATALAAQRIRPLLNPAG